MIEVLVSDLGQVVLPFDFTPTRQFLMKRSRRGLSEEDAWKVVGELHDQLRFGCGGCTGEEFFERLRQELDLDTSYNEFCHAFANVFSEDHDLMDLIRRARVKHRFLLSNTNVIHWEWIIRRHAEILSSFDRLLASQDLGCMKPDAEIYRKVEALTGIAPKKHLMIDDIAENITGARACGWDGIVYVGTAELERELRKRGLLEQGV